MIQRRGDGGKQVRRVAAVDEHLAATAGRVFADQHQRRRVVAMLDDVAAVPGDLFRAVTQEVIGLEVAPELIDRLLRHVALRQQLLRLALVLANAQSHVGRVLQPLAQRLLGSEVELAQQGALPVVPEGVVGGADIGHGEAVKQVEMLLVAHLLGKVGDHVRVIDIAALGGDRHQQMVAHQPGDQPALVAIEAVQLAEFQRIDGTKFGVIATPPLGDIVKQGGDAEQLRFAQPGEHFMAERVTLAVGRVGKAVNVLEQPMGVFIDRVGVEHVELHLADDEVPLRQVGRQNAVLVHQAHRQADTVGVAQQRHEQATALRQILQPAVELAPRFAQLAQGGGVDTGNLGMLGHLVEEAQDGGGLAGEQLGVYRINEAATELELVGKAAHIHGAVAKDRLVKQLQQHLVELGDPPHRLVEALHHLLDRRVAFPLEAQHLGHGALAVEQQAVIPFVDGHVQGKAHLPEEILAVEQFAILGPVEKAVAGHLEQGGGTEVATGDPGEGLDVAQAARIALEIRLQLVGGAEKLLVPLGLLLALGAKELLARPEVLGAGCLFELPETLLATGDVARLNEVGGHRDVGLALLDALRHVAYRLTHLELEIPQQGNELADAQSQHLVQLVAVIEDQQVDVGVGVQLASAITAYRDEGEVALVEAKLLPEAAEQLIHIFGAGGNQLDDVVTGIEAGVQPAEKAAQVLFAVVAGELVVG